MAGQLNATQRWARCMIFVVLSVCPRSIRADAWTQPAGHGQIIWNMTFTQISHGFNSAGNITPFGDGGRFRKLEMNPYFEYGLNAATTLVVNAFLPALQYSNNYGSNRSFGLGDVTAGVRRRLTSPDSTTVVSAEFTFLFPTYATDRNPAPGNHQVDLVGRLAPGHGFQVARHHGFLRSGQHPGGPGRQMDGRARLPGGASSCLLELRGRVPVPGRASRRPVPVGRNLGTGPERQIHGDGSVLWHHRHAQRWGLGRDRDQQPQFAVGLRSEEHTSELQ